MTELLNKTLAQIVTEKHQAASVFEKYHLDFCCKGKRPLSDAIVERHLSAEQVKQGSVIICVFLQILLLIL